MGYLAPLSCLRPGEGEGGGWKWGFMVEKSLWLCLSKFMMIILVKNS